jgi:hypothetical protein
VSQPACKPNSVSLDSACPRGPASRGTTTIPLSRRSLAGSSDLPGGVRLRQGHRRNSPAWRKRRGRAVRLACANATLFGLAPCGVLPATDVTAGAVRSYRTFSPLPLDSSRPCGRDSLGAVCFLCHYPSGHPARALPGALPFGVRTFLPPPPFGLRRGKLESLLTITRVRKPAVVWLTATDLFSHATRSMVLALPSSSVLEL